MVFAHRAGHGRRGTAPESARVERQAPQNRALARPGGAREEQCALVPQHAVVEGKGGWHVRFARCPAEAGGLPGAAVLIELPGIVLLSGRLGGPGLWLWGRLEERSVRIDIGDDEALADVPRVPPCRVTVQPRVELLDPRGVDLRRRFRSATTVCIVSGRFSLASASLPAKAMSQLRPKKSSTISGWALASR